MKELGFLSLKDDSSPSAMASLTSFCPSLTTYLETGVPHLHRNMLLLLQVNPKPLDSPPNRAEYQVGSI